MTVSFEVPPTAENSSSPPSITTLGKTKVALEDCSAKADNIKRNDNVYSEPMDKIRQTKVIDHCDHGTHSLENGLRLRGAPIEKTEKVKSASRSLIIQIGMTLIFCACEFFTGVFCSSIAMLADSYHMAADVMALIVAFVCIKIATRPSTRHGYGWVRAETLGGYFNGIFMCTVCVMVLQEAFGRLIHAHVITNPVSVLGIGFIGLMINVYGLFNMSGHGHSHGGGGHGHSHGFGGHGHAHDKKSKRNKKHEDHEDDHEHSHSDDGHGHSHNNGHGHSHDHDDHDDCHSNGKTRNTPENAKSEALTRLLEDEVSDEIVERRLSGVNNHPIIATVDRQMTPYGTHMASDVLNSTIELKSSDKKKKSKKRMNVNIHGVWLHLMSDALGSIIVMISATFVWLLPEWAMAKYIDPLLTICLATFMGITAVVLVRTSAKKLLKLTPEGLEINKVKKDLCSIVGVSMVEKLSVWVLCDERIIASAHVNICHPAIFPEAAHKIKKYFHDMGVHSTTIEPTFEDTCMQSMKVLVKKMNEGTSVEDTTTVEMKNETCTTSH
ncbi:CRE-CDF-1 protein [Caenorhabditis remanei]|uniref:CRE-CDF-1 protein n=1 Tax=Caenorhabditis remanei TaxID=31234 RepID=E3LDG9_CAERE|nr:CRE-CDF-1 protein [Caenorhabditis remanei]